jgi:Arc/MetJ-type ribon-helix-helix transcriptional regulator
MPFFDEFVMTGFMRDVIKDIDKLVNNNLDRFEDRQDVIRSAVNKFIRDEKLKNKGSDKQNGRKLFKQTK